MQATSHISLYKLPSDTRNDLWNLSMEAARTASAVNTYPMNSFYDSSEFRTVTPPSVVPAYESNMNTNPNILIADKYEEFPESQPQFTMKPLEPMETYASPQDTSDVEALMNHYMSGKHPSIPSSLYDSDDIMDIMTSAAALVMMKHGQQVGYGSTAYEERYPDSESESSTDWLESDLSDEEDFSGRVTRNSNRRKRKQSSKRTQKGTDSFDMDSTGGARNSRKKQKTGSGPQSLGKSKYPKTLALSEEKEKANLNQLHQFVRKDLLEIVLVKKNERNSKNRLYPGRVGLTCTHCAKLNINNSASTFYPKTLDSLYRDVCTFQRVHLVTCANIPDTIKDRYKHLKQSDKTRGKTVYWKDSAKALSLQDSKKGQGLEFA